MANGLGRQLLGLKEMENGEARLSPLPTSELLPPSRVFMFTDTVVIYKLPGVGA